MIAQKITWPGGGGVVKCWILAWFPSWPNWAFAVMISVQHFGQICDLGWQLPWLAVIGTTNKTTFSFFGERVATKFFLFFIQKNTGSPKSS